MKEELDKALCEKYPKIFAQRNGSPSETCMCWGFACGDGWYNIIDRLCGLIQWRIDQRIDEIERITKYHTMRASALAGDWTLFNQYHDGMTESYVERERKSILGPLPKRWEKIPEPIPQVVAVQVKEKFGGLRFYVDGGDEVTHAYITMAESMSGVTCEACGAPGKTGGRGWIRTLCVKHSVEDDEDE